MKHSEPTSRRGFLAGSALAAAAALAGGAIRRPAGAAGAAFQQAPAAQPLEWPNEQSRANSDAWLAENHERIALLRPRLLVINYANNQTADEVRAKVERVIEIFREATRYHGYKDKAAPPNLQYEVAKFIDLADRPDPRPEGERLDGNSTAWPRLPKDGWPRESNFDYAVLYGEEYARRYGYEDPQRPGKFLALAELVEQGVFHEVWILGRHGSHGSPFEGIERKQRYDGRFRKVAGEHVQAGNGGSQRQPWIGRSLRIMFMNTDRGPGCFLESWGHCIERVGTSRAILWFSRHFNEFANLDWNERYGLDSHSLYGHSDDPIEYPDPSTIRLKSRGEPFVIEDYDAKGGNVHFPPNGRRDYDLANTQPVCSSIENFRLWNGPDGQDLREPWDNSRLEQYREFSPDCMGPWLVYWYQNFIGHDSPAREENGERMKSWWPFLFY